MSDIKEITQDEQLLVNYVSLYDSQTIVAKADVDLSHTGIQRIRHFSNQKFSIGELKKALGHAKYRKEDGINRVG